MVMTERAAGLLRDIARIAARTAAGSCGDASMRWTVAADRPDVL
jgi:hypothetical protein